MATKGQVRREILEKLKGLGAFERVYNGKPPLDSINPCVGLIIPVTEAYIEESNGQRNPKLNSVDLLFEIKISSGEVKDFDDLIESVKSVVPKINSIIGAEWEHDEEFINPDAARQGITIFYKAQFSV